MNHHPYMLDVDFECINDRRCERVMLAGLLLFSLIQTVVLIAFILSLKGAMTHATNGFDKIGSSLSKFAAQDAKQFDDSVQSFTDYSLILFNNLQTIIAIMNQTKN